MGLGETSIPGVRSQVWNLIHNWIQVWIRIFNWIQVWISIYKRSYIWIQIYKWTYIWIQICCRIHIWIQIYSRTYFWIQICCRIHIWIQIYSRIHIWIQICSHFIVEVDPHRLPVIITDTLSSFSSRLGSYKCILIDIIVGISWLFFWDINSFKFIPILIRSLIQLKSILPHLHKCPFRLAPLTLLEGNTVHVVIIINLVRFLVINGFLI